MKWKTCGKCGVPTIPDSKGKCRSCGAQMTNKNHAQIIHMNGHTFRSKGEFERYQALCWRQEAKFLSALEYRPARVWLMPRVGWDLDYRYFDTETALTWWEDFKGKEERDYLLKKEMWAYLGPGPLRISIRHPKTGLFHIDEEIRPVGIQPLVAHYQKARAA